MPKKANKKLKLKVVKSTKTSSNGKSLVQDKRYVRRDSKGQFVDKPNTGVDKESSKADKMFEKVWQDIHDRRDQRVG